jgi:hypothetical protein
LLHTPKRRSDSSGSSEEAVVSERRFRGRPGSAPQELREGSPRIPEAFERGSFLSVTVRSGNDVSGYVCDRDGTGLLLDIRDASGDPHGYEFVPWSSIERVKIL